MKVEFVSVEAFIASLKLTVSGEFVDVPVLPLVGVVVSTVGIGPPSVVKLQEVIEPRDPPDVSPLAAIAAVYCALNASAFVGVKVAIELATVYETVPGTASPYGPVSVNVEPLIAFMGRVNVAVTDTFTGTSVAPLIGVTVASVETGSAVVVKLQ